MNHPVHFCLNERVLELNDEFPEFSKEVVAAATAVSVVDATG